MKYDIELILTNKCPYHCKHCYAIINNETMSDKVLDEAIKYIRDKATQNPDNDYLVRLIGGEISLLGADYMSSIIDRLNDIPNVRFDCRSNLLFELTDEWINFFKKNGGNIGTSYDYGNVRYSNTEQEALWHKNVDILYEKGITVDCIICITKYVIENIKPEEIFDMLKRHHIKYFELERILKPLQTRPEYEAGNIAPLNRDTDSYMFKLFRLYEKESRDVLDCETFECLLGTLKNDFYYEHGRCCEKDSTTITPNGNVSNCFYTVKTPYYNLITKQYNEENYKHNISLEETYKPACKNCQFFKYCNGDCPMFQWDETGCPGLKLIYTYLLDKNEEE